MGDLVELTGLKDGEPVSCVAVFGEHADFESVPVDRRVMVIGAETLSRVIDPHDRDSMIYADGAGATILEGKEDETLLVTEKQIFTRNTFNI